MERATSIRQLGRALEVSEGAVRKWLAHPQWRWGPRPPTVGWPVAEIAEWRRATLPPDPARPSSRDAGLDQDQQQLLETLRGNPFARARLSLLVERAALAKLEREMLLGNWVKRDEVEEENVQKILFFKQMLLQLPRIAAPLLINQSDAVHIEQYLRERVLEYLEFLAGQRKFLPPGWQINLENS